MKREKKKINPLMKESKRIKSINVGSDDENVIRKFIIITVVIVVLITGVYFLTELTKNNNASTNTATGAIDYDIVSIGTLLNRPESEYYVMIYDKENEDSMLYSALITNYYNLTDHTKIYFCDLGNKLNKSYYNVNNDNKSNPNAQSIKELDLGDLTLIKVKNGKIVQYVETYEQIKNILK